MIDYLEWCNRSRIMISDDFNVLYAYQTCYCNHRSASMKLNVSQALGMVSLAIFKSFHLCIAFAYFKLLCL